MRQREEMGVGRRREDGEREPCWKGKGGEYISIRRSDYITTHLDGCASAPPGDDAFSISARTSSNTLAACVSKTLYDDDKAQRTNVSIVSRTCFDPCAMQ